MATPPKEEREMKWQILVEVEDDSTNRLTEAEAIAIPMSGMLPVGGSIKMISCEEVKNAGLSSK